MIRSERLTSRIGSYNKRVPLVGYSIRTSLFTLLSVHPIHPIHSLHPLSALLLLLLLFSFSEYVQIVRLEQRGGMNPKAAAPLEKHRDVFPLPPRRHLAAVAAIHRRSLDDPRVQLVQHRAQNTAILYRERSNKRGRYIQETESVCGLCE